MKQQISFGLAFWLLLLLSAWLYFPGLHSGFILDDEVNLDALADFDDPLSHDALRFILEGESSSLGRPLSLVSFALQAYQWPNPIPFKYINLLIHLLNATLIFWLLLRLCRLMQLSEAQSLWLALLSTAVWVLHPFQVSTTLYVVQRMAQLGAFFTLFGVLLYLIGRTALHEQRPWNGLLWMSFGIGLGGIFGVLSKETAILLPLYVLVTEFTLLAHLPRSRLWYAWSSVFLFLPLLLLVTYFTLTWHSLMASYSLREFNVSERLLSETRILWDYLGKILLPTPNRFSVFHDDLEVSTSLLQPLSTLWATLGGVLISALALWQRKHWSVFSFAVFWFLGGHSLESSVVPLKLYFEHRNYLPLLGVAFALVYFFYALLSQIAPAKRRLLLIAPVLWFATLPFISWMEIQLWQRPLTQAALWAELKPNSGYAQSHYASKLSEFGQFVSAIKIYQQMAQRLPNDLSPYLLWLNIHCYKPETPAPDLEQLQQRLARTPGDEAFGVSLDILLSDWQDQACPTLISADFLEQQIFQPLLQNSPLDPAYRNLLYHNYARFQAMQGNYAKAIEIADQAQSLQNDFKLKLEHIHWLLQAGQPTAAHDYVQALLPTLNWKENYLHRNYLEYVLNATAALPKQPHPGAPHE